MPASPSKWLPPVRLIPLIFGFEYFNIWMFEYLNVWFKYFILNCSKMGGATSPSGFPPVRLIPLIGSALCSLHHSFTHCSIVNQKIPKFTKITRFILPSPTVQLSTRKCFAHSWFEYQQFLSNHALKSFIEKAQFRVVGISVKCLARENFSKLLFPPPVVQV